MAYPHGNPERQKELRRRAISRIVAGRGGAATRARLKGKYDDSRKFDSTGTKGRKKLGGGTGAVAKHDEALQVRAAKRLARGKGGANTVKRAGNTSFDVSKHTGGVDVQELINRRKAAADYK